VPIGGIIGGIGSIVGGITGAIGSSNAASQDVGQLEKGLSTLQGNEKDTLGNYQPYLQAGSQAVGNLNQMLGTPGQGLLTPWTQQFTAPTAQQAAQTPGYQFQLQQGLNAIQNSAAGQGGLLSGSTLAGMNNYAQGVASTNYQNTFGNALTQYQNAYQTFLNNQNNTYSRLMGLTGVGQTAAGQYGQSSAQFGGDIASLYGQIGAAKAGGTLGTTNAITNTLGNLSDMAMLGGFNPSVSGAPMAGVNPSSLSYGGASAGLPMDPNNPGYYLPGGIPPPQ